MQARTRQLDAVRETPEQVANTADVPNILENEIKQAYRDRGAEDHLDEAQDDEPAEEEEDEESEEEVVRAAEANRNQTSFIRLRCCTRARSARQVQRKARTRNSTGGGQMAVSGDRR
jgi:hypothetical protein